jgi:hypothetical protein
MARPVRIVRHPIAIGSEPPVLFFRSGLREWKRTLALADFGSKIL